MFDEPVVRNKNGVNSKIQAHILSDEEMQKLYFYDTNGKWIYHRMIPFPKYMQLKGWEISFSIEIPKDGSPIRIDVIDDDFGQPYDYQLMLRYNDKFEPALIVLDFVEKEMERLQKHGVLSGHIRGEYI